MVESVVAVSTNFETVMDTASDKRIALSKEVKELFNKFEAKPENHRTKGASNTQLIRLDVTYQTL